MRAPARKTTAKAPRSEAATGNGSNLPNMGRLESVPGFLIGRAWRDAQRRFERHFAKLKISAAQYAILILLEANEGCTPGQLAVGIGMGHNNLVVILDDLVDRGLIERTPCIDDRRKKRLSLTKAGLALLRKANAAEDRNTAELVEKFGAAESAQLLALLRQF